MNRAIAASLLLLAAACATVPTPSLDDEIVARGDAFLRLYAAKDVEAAAALFTEAAELTPPGMNPIVGRRAIRSYIAQTVGMNVKNSVTRDAIDVAGSRAVERGKYEIRLGLFAVRGTYTIDWRREGGVWKIAKYVAVD